MGRPAWMPGELRSGQGWPVAACPRSGTGARGLERSESRTQGQGLFAYFCGCLAKVSRRKGGTRKKSLCIRWICTLSYQKLRVHIRYMCLAELRVSPLRRGTFGKRPKSTQKVCALPYGRARLGSPGALSPVLLWGHAATGHPWPDRGWLGVLPRHPHNSTCVQPSVRGLSVVPTVSVAAGMTPKANSKQQITKQQTPYRRLGTRGPFQE